MKKSISWNGLWRIILVNNDEQLYGNDFLKHNSCMSSNDWDLVQKQHPMWMKNLPRKSTLLVIRISQITRNNISMQGPKLIYKTFYFGQQRLFGKLKKIMKCFSVTHVINEYVLSQFKFQRKKLVLAS